jgi:hypothetical protein
MILNDKDYNLIKMECSICYNKINDSHVEMTCMSRHSFCFKCIIENVETHSELKPCPLCRGGSKYILLNLGQATKGSTGSFYSTDYFLESLPIINKLIKCKFTNSCLVSEEALVFYVKNKKQINMFNKLVRDRKEENAEEDTIDELIDCIKWERKDESKRSIFGSLFNGLSDMEPGEVYGGVQLFPLSSEFAQAFSRAANGPANGPNNGPNNTE